MKYNDLKKRIIAATENPDTIQTTLMEVLEEVKADYDGIETLTQELEKANTRIRDLQDTNHKLFLATTGSVDEEPEAIDEDDKPAGVGAAFEELNKLITSTE